MEEVSKLINSLSDFEQLIGYSFKDKEILIKTIVHPTFSHENKVDFPFDNQRLEFLGDSVLGLVTAEHLFKKHQDADEGDMTQIRAHFVNKNYLSLKAKEIELDKYILLGKGEEKIGGRANSTNLSGALEALIAAIYVDGGIESARIFVEKFIIV